MKKKIYVNSIAALSQTIITGLILFFLYRFLVNTIGVSALGAWSIVFAVASLMRIAELGISGSIIKFVAKYKAQEDEKKIILLMQTSIISVFLLLSIFIIVSYLPTVFLLRYIIPSESIGFSLKILPYVIFSIFISVIAGIFLAFLDGLNRIDLRGLIMIIANIVYITSAYVWVPQFGIIGLAYSHLFHSSILLIMGWIFAYMIFVKLPIIPKKFNKNILSEVIGYSINFQISTVVIMLFEPMTKALLSKFGSLSLVGYFEMINRMVIQFRALIVSTNQVMVPVIAHLHETESDKLNKLYQDSYRLMVYFSIPLYGTLFCLIPTIAEFWVGSADSMFILFSFIIIIGWFLNTLISPAYFDNLGRGTLFWNTMSHVVIGVLNLILGIALGFFFDGIGVIIAWFISLSLGSLVVLIAYHRNHNIPFASIFPEENTGFLLITIFSIAVVWSTHYFFYDSRFYALFVFVFMFVFFIKHPLMKNLTSSMNQLK